MGAAKHPVKELIDAKEPGVFTVLADMMKGGVLCAVAGAALGAVVGGVMGSIPSISLFGGTGILDGAMLGATLGTVIGVPCGCAKGVSEIRHYYNDIAIPQIKEAELSKGKMLGAELEQTAAALEQESQRFRTLIVSKGNYMDAATLANIEPMGRA